jgi:inhibitor of cysteine peptidase
MKKTNISNAISVVLFVLLIITTTLLIIDKSDNNNNTINPNEESQFEKIDYDPQLNIKKNNFNSIDQLNSFIKEYSSSNSGGSVLRTFASTTMEFAEAGAVNDGMMLAKAGGSDVDFSETNVQVTGIDEADIIKTDGKYIYTISGNTIFIIDAYPGENAKIISEIELKSRPSNLFIYDDKLAVFGNFNDADYFKKKDLSVTNSMTFFNIYDLEDIKSPSLIKEFKFEGNYFNARLIDNHVYFVSSQYPNSREIPMPLIIEDDIARNVKIGNVFFYNINYDHVNFMSVHSINMDQIKNTDSITVAVESGQNMYMSFDNLYITYTQRINEYELQQDILKDLLQSKLSESDIELIKKINSADNDILNSYEKESKIMQIYYGYLYQLDSNEQETIQENAEEMLLKKLEEYDYLEFTVINQINVNDGKITLGKNGNVPGRIINQFSMDQSNNIFRIATTLSARWSRFGKERTESTNNVFTLDMDMNILDSIKEIAPGESIFSTRFIGDKLYMVTFEQVDPFFVIDLSNPKDIEILGKLKIPGFSRYLHPYDENTIIGIGRDATDTGRTKGLKISLFDVSEFDNPKEIAQFVTDEKYAQSTALYEHKAFLFSKEKNMLVIPAYSHEYDNRYGEGKGYNGAFVFHITKEEIELRGLIDHSMSNNNYWSNLVERSLYIEELLYTKSPTLLRINQIDTLESVKNIDLVTDNSDFEIY